MAELSLSAAPMSAIAQVTTSALIVVAEAIFYKATGTRRRVGKEMGRREIGFTLLTAAIIIAAHAIAFFTHEFSHSLTAWVLGYMPHPLALDYGQITPANIVLMLDVGDNVQYDAILRPGHGLAAAIIALAGATIGNGLVYCVVWTAYKRRRSPRSVTASIVFWLMMMCAGNVWSYVPVRAITTHADIAIAATGLHVHVFVLFSILLVPSLLLVSHFFTRTCLLVIPVIAEGEPARAATIAALTTAWFYMFFGAVGLWGNYGEVSQAFSIFSIVVLMPITFCWLWPQLAPKIQ